jgi:release factor glutamine methyltransferase
LTVGQALEAAIRSLEQGGVPGYRRDAELLLAQLLSTDRGGLLVRRQDPLPPSIAAQYERWVARRRTRVPLQHVIGEQSFFGFDFKVDRRVLVPRPETELLVESALALELPQGAQVVDLGTGSGCIAVSLARLRPDLQVQALDRSTDALDVARENARVNGVLERLAFVHGDLSEPPSAWFGTLDLVASNPPYVTEAEWALLEPEVREHDPREALVAGPTGYEIYRTLVPLAYQLLRGGGWFLLELGQGQAATVQELAAVAGFDAIRVHPDLRGIPRVLQAFKPA